MSIKQKTTITIAKIVTNHISFNEYISIPHRVHEIIVHSIGFIILDAGPAVVESAFYITSDMITNPHDQILGVAGNIGFPYNDTRMKKFIYTNEYVNGTFNFYIYNLQTLEPNTNLGGTTVHIDIEFIEYNKS